MNIDEHFLNKKCEANNCQLRGSRPFKNWKRVELNWYCEKHFFEYALISQKSLKSFIKINRDPDKRKRLTKEQIKLYKHYTEDDGAG